MTFEGIVRNGVVELPSNASVPDGTVVRVEAPCAKSCHDLLAHAGTWEGDDADRIVEEIYALRSSAPPRVPLDP